MISFILLTTAFAVYFTSQTAPVKRRYIYPNPYQELITTHARANGIPAALVASVIMHESKFAENAKSHRGALGLMQIMPETGKWIAGELSDESFSPEDLKNPETNIRYGTWYLGWLLRDFGGNEALALAAYNAGRSTVREWAEERGWRDDFDDADDIPYEETRLYVRRVLKDRKNYEKLYPDMKIPR